MTTLTDYYEVLQVSPKADPEVIQAAYRRLLFKWHPDKNPGDPWASKQMALLDEAYEVLSDPQRRREYDLLRKRSATNGGGKPEREKAAADAKPDPEPATPQPSSHRSPASDAGEVTPEKGVDDRPKLSDFTVSTAIATVVIWGVCRMIFGPHFGGLLEGFLVLTVAGIVGPWIGRLFASEMPPRASEPDAPKNPDIPEKETPTSSASDSRPPKASSTDARSPEATPEARPESLETMSVAMWVIFSLGAFLFVMAHGSTLFARPGLFLGTCLIWGMVFGIPAYVCVECRNRTGMTAVVTLFLLASGLDVAVPIYVHQEMKIMSHEHLAQVPQLPWPTPSLHDLNNQNPFEALEHPLELLTIPRIFEESVNRERSWQDTAAELRSVGAQSHVDKLKQHYETAIQQKKLVATRQAEATEGESQVRIPVVSAIGEWKQIERYRLARERFNAWKATQQDIDIIVRCERLQGTSQ